MSSELIIPIEKPLKTADLIQEIRCVLQNLLGLAALPPILVEVIEGIGVANPLLPLLLEEKSKALQVFFQDKTRFETGVTIYVSYSPDYFSKDSDTDILAVSVSMTGGGRATRLRYVMAAGCAIAVARQAASKVQDYSHQWGNGSIYDPETFLDMIRCQQQHNSVEAAFSEVLHNIERAKAQCA